MGVKKLLLLCLLFVIYLLLGGCVFHYLESEEEERLRQQVFRLQESVSGEDKEDLQHICTPVDAVNLTELEPSEGVLGVTCCVPPDKLDAIETTVRKRVKRRLAELDQKSRENKTCIRLEETPIMSLSGDELDAIIDVVLLAVSRGLDPRSTEENNSPPKWSFSGACSFSVTVVTTIGYGNLAPYTEGGQAFCVAYGTFGIPLTAVLLAKIAQGLGGLAVRIADKIRRSRPQWNPKVIRNIVNTCFVTLGLCVFLILPALTVSLIEGWNYLRSLYFMFVSLSTIGFGDYVAASQRDVKYSAVYQITISAWILCGLAFLALVFDLITGGIEKVSGKVESKEADTDETTTENDDETTRGEIFTACVCKEAKQRSGNASELSAKEEEDNDIDEIVLKTTSAVAMDGKNHPKGKNVRVKPGYFGLNTSKSS
ncbi:PREDICTED: potassium channel subfamily K member 10-like [Branchiostoma belcheri]|uniref:Potassium channel subfamily K member 10-like n=1 Tax=Branchiostoma belcheri TaxID=7741 RepID=A0A6P4YY47_BRABE|nr:PREDICTED: potassium channel subfamily K member 10-like [Branchiostoma belcheri]